MSYRTSPIYGIVQMMHIVIGSKDVIISSDVIRSRDVISNDVIRSRCYFIKWCNWVNRCLYIKRLDWVKWLWILSEYMCFYLLVVAVYGWKQGLRLTMVYRAQILLPMMAPWWAKYPTQVRVNFHRSGAVTMLDFCGKPWQSTHFNVYISSCAAQRHCTTLLWKSSFRHQ